MDKHGASGGCQLSWIFTGNEHRALSGIKH